MKSAVFAIGVLAIGAATPARADYALIRYSSGYCGVWYDSKINPPGSGWKKLGVAADWAGAWAEREKAVAKKKCW